LFLLPPLNKLSLDVTGEEISTNKRKAPDEPESSGRADEPESSGRADELPKNEMKDIAEGAVELVTSLTDLMTEQTLQAVETQTKTLLAAQPMLFQVSPEDIIIRTNQLEKALNKALANNPVACPAGSSSVRLVQSLKAPFFAMVHHPFGEPWPKNGPFSDEDTELTKAREKLRKVVNSIGRPTSGSSSEAQSSDTVANENLQRFENNLARLLLFGDVQVVPFPKRTAFLKEHNGEMERDLVSQPYMDAIRMHMELLFSAVHSKVRLLRSMDQRIAKVLPIKKGVDEKPLITMIQHILDDLKASHIDESNSKLAKEYWKYLYMIFDTNVNLVDGEYQGNQEAELWRSTAPNDSDSKAFTDVLDAYANKDIERRSTDDEFDLKTAYIKFFMRVAMYGGWSWFANASINIFALNAILFRVCSSPTKSGQLVEERQSSFVHHITAQNDGELSTEQQVLDGQGRSSGNPTEEYLGSDAKEAETAPAGQATDFDNTGANTTNDFLVIQHAVLYAAVEPNPGAGHDRVARSQMGADGKNDREEQTDSGVNPSASDAVNTLELRYIALSQVNNEIQKGLQDTQNELQQALSMLESVDKEIVSKEQHVGELELKLTQARSDAEEKKEHLLVLVKASKRLQEKQTGQNAKLQEELEYAQREADDKNIEIERLQSEFENTKQELKENLETVQSRSSERVGALEKELAAMKIQLEKAQLAANTRSSSSSCESRDPSRAAVYRLQEQMDMLEYSLRAIKNQVQHSESNPNGLNIKAVVEQLKKMGNDSTEMKETANDIKNKEMLKQLESMSAVARLHKLYYKETTDVFGRVYGLYKKAKHLAFVLSFLVRLSEVNRNALNDIVGMGLFSVASHVMVEVVAQTLSGNASYELNQFLIENVDMRSFIMLYQNVIEYFYHGRIFPRGLVRMADRYSMGIIPNAADGITTILNLKDSWVAGLVGMGLDIFGLKKLVAIALAGAGAIYTLPALCKWSREIYKSLPTAPVIGRTAVKLSLLVLEGLQAFGTYYQGWGLYNFIWNPEYTVHLPNAKIVVEGLRLGYTSGKQFLQSLLEDPRITVSLIALAFAFVYANRKYKIMDKSKTFVKNKLAKRSKWFQDRPDTGEKTIENLTVTEQVAILRAIKNRSEYSNLGGRTDEGSSSDSGEAAEATLPGEADEEEYGEEDGEEAMEFAIVAGTRVENDVCGTFVLLAEPHKNPGVSVAACAALMLSTDLHGLGR